MRVAMQRGTEGVKYLLGDHLGSASVALNADGTQLGAQGYRPWGAVNFTEGTIPTEYTFTGQFSYVSSFGMMYFNARWFLPYLNRWAQPDSIVPDQYNPLDWDRYSYVRNNPLKYTDPSGHQICLDDGYCGKDGRNAGSLAESLFENEDWWRFKKVFGFQYKGTWTPEMKLAAYQAIFLIAMALSALAPGFTPEAIFKTVYGSSLVLEYGECSECKGGFGYTHSASYIKFGGSYNNLSKDTRLIVHELGHAFDHAIGKSGRGDLNGRMGLCNNSEYCLGRDSHNGPNDGEHWGFAGGFNKWQFGSDDTTGEVFADMFLGWVFNTWEPESPLSNRGTIRQGYMNDQMINYMTTYFIN
jgi:RHS repeat-associated protein